MLTFFYRASTAFSLLGSWGTPGAPRCKEASQRSAIADWRWAGQAQRGVPNPPVPFPSPGRLYRHTMPQSGQIGACCTPPPPPPPPPPERHGRKHVRYLPTPSLRKRPLQRNILTSRANAMAGRQVPPAQSDSTQCLREACAESAPNMHAC